MIIVTLGYHLILRRRLLYLLFRVLSDFNEALWEIEGILRRRAFRDQCLNSPNADQRHAFDTITASIGNGYQGSKIFNINAPGGCGKTYLLNGILAHLRGMGHKCIAAASSGIAATLLNGGRTAHSFFGIPIPISNTSTCNITLKTNLGTLLQESKLIIWDEALMTHSDNILTVNRMFQDLTKINNELFGDINHILWRSTTDITCDT